MPHRKRKAKKPSRRKASKKKNILANLFSTGGKSSAQPLKKKKRKQKRRSKNFRRHRIPMLRSSPFDRMARSPPPQRSGSMFSLFGLMAPAPPAPKTKGIKASLFGLARPAGGRKLGWFGRTIGRNLANDTNEPKRTITKKKVVKKKKSKRVQKVKKVLTKTLDGRVFKMTKKSSLANTECCICLENMRPTQKVVSTKCNHTYHYKCLNQVWRAGAMEGADTNDALCPLCREPIGSKWV